MKKNWLSIPKELRQKNNWIGVIEGSKIPLDPIYDRAASSTNPSTWSDFNTVHNLINDGEFDYPGFVFNDCGYVGIDIDIAYGDDKFLNELTLDVLNRCKSYTEISKSGRGFHIILKGDLPFKGRNNRNGLEIYKSDRYFIMTANTFLYKEIISNQKAIDYIVSKYFQIEHNERYKNEDYINETIYKPIWNKSKDKTKFKVKPYYPTIEQGARNISLISLAGYFINLDWSHKQIQKELIRVNKLACKPPLSLKEVKTIARSIERYRKVDN